MTSRIPTVRSPLVVACLVAAGASLLARQGPPPPMRGFTAAGAAAERRMESRFRALPQPDSIRAFHREFTKSPHPATSARTKEIAEYIAATWKAQGLD